MRRPLPIHVEPLSPQRWAKIERAVMGRLEAGALGEPLPSLASSAPARPKSWIAVLAAALVLLGIGLAAVERGGEAGPSHTSRITTGRESSHLALPGLTLDVDPDSTVVVGDAADQALLVVVDKGSVVCDVTPRSPKAPLIVQAGGVQVRVIGTRFRVERQGESARVAVDHGVVEVSAGGHLARVRAGEVWPANPPRLTAPTAPAAPEPSVNVESTEERASTSSRRSSSPTGNRSELAQAQFERAARLERSAPDSAINLYRGLEPGLDSWAANALFAHARLESARGNGAEAKRLLSLYLRRFPRGSNAADARAMLARAN